MNKGGKEGENRKRSLDHHQLSGRSSGKELFIRAFKRGSASKTEKNERISEGRSLNCLSVRNVGRAGVPVIRKMGNSACREDPWPGVGLGGSHVAAAKKGVASQIGFRRDPGGGTAVDNNRPHNLDVFLGTGLRASQRY